MFTSTEFNRSNDSEALGNNSSKETLYVKELVTSSKWSDAPSHRHVNSYIFKLVAVVRVSPS